MSDAVDFGVIFSSRVDLQIVPYRGSDSLILNEVSQPKVLLNFPFVGRLLGLNSGRVSKA